MSIIIKTVSLEVEARHPGCVGIEPHAFEEKEVKIAVRRDGFRLLNVMVKLFLFVVLLFVLPITSPTRVHPFGVVISTQQVVFP